MFTRVWAISGHDTMEITPGYHMRSLHVLSWRINAKHVPGLASSFEFYQADPAVNRTHSSGLFYLFGRIIRYVKEKRFHVITLNKLC